jgi:hypothetical protein
MTRKRAYFVLMGAASACLCWPGHRGPARFTARPARITARTRLDLVGSVGGEFAAKEGLPERVRLAW